MAITFTPRGDKQQVEHGDKFSPKFDDNGLITAVCTDRDTGDILMVAYMNDEALRHTLTTRHAHFYSRSRQKQWKKGESSGHILEVHELRTDCDQDCLWLKCTITNSGGACHNGYKSCFYRAVNLNNIGTDPVAMTHVGGEPLFDPSAVYGKK